MNLNAAQLETFSKSSAASSHGEYDVNQNIDESWALDLLVDLERISSDELLEEIKVNPETGKSDFDLLAKLDRETAVFERLTTALDSASELTAIQKQIAAYEPEQRKLLVAQEPSTKVGKVRKLMQKLGFI